MSRIFGWTCDLSEAKWKLGAAYHKTSLDDVLFGHIKVHFYSDPAYFHKSIGIVTTSGHLILYFPQESFSEPLITLMVRMELAFSGRTTEASLSIGSVVIYSKISCVVEERGMFTMLVPEKKLASGSREWGRQCLVSATGSVWETIKAKVGD